MRTVEVDERQVESDALAALDDAIRETMLLVKHHDLRLDVLRMARRLRTGGALDADDARQVAGDLWRIADAAVQR